ncbi:hypothetical protein PC129_g14972 [Phytophthora cactorum]|uniref:WD40-repeat-containing domain n=2 Tax=Phytophthora cactorum TaxID=29920 RepID=A0A329RPU5_9STRA|nr:hypothetical protein Pcac1_g13330 [Phytophthora cactorum]KAG2811355.1 hypothetical protein PC112_g15653 [Phytophthora cactorum]KAG2812674.1 hypothetical protein PC111_g14705 [Phytophthora cactorum]KAG2859838.1 hypothetical protein PC113_g8584 [Phytophthora cactorum]KAG2913017.1 hypothetical protein PC114_g8715 [Phytophthora cactorum]
MFQSAVIHDEYEFTGHNSALGAVCYNRHQDTFVSVDDACLRLWRAQTGGQLRIVSLPARTTRFIQAITYIDARQIFVASALDGALRLYDPNLNELAALFTGRGTVLSLVFDGQHNRLLTGGVDGCTAWQIKPRPSGMPEGALNAHYEFTHLPKFFHGTAVTHSSRNKPQPKSPNASLGRAGWVERLQLGPENTRLYAQTRHWIDVFNTVDGAHLERWDDLFSAEHGTLTAFVVQERAKYLVCGTSSGAIVVLSHHPITIVHVFKDHTQTITSLTEHAASRLVISSSLDGSVRLWDLEARRQAHRLNVGHSVHALQWLAPSSSRATEVELAGRFCCQLRNTVKIYSIQSILKEHQPCQVPVCVLQRVVFQVKGLSRARVHSEATEGNENKSSDSDEEDESSAAKAKQLVLLVCMDKTIRVFAGRMQNEPPSFTWIPDEQALDLVAFALHPVSQHLFLLLSSQKLLIVNASPRQRSRTTTEDGDIGEIEPQEGTAATTSSIERMIDLNSSTVAGEPGGSIESSSNFTGSRGSGSTRTALRCICVCPFPPVFNAVPSNRPQVRTGRSARHRRQSHFGSGGTPVPSVPPLLRRNALIHSEWEWIACGSAFGQLLFWHTGLRGGREAALTLDAHDAPIVNINASASSPLLVTLDADSRVHLWSLQPEFALRHVLELGQSPTVFALSPLSEIILSGHDDGRVVLHAVGYQTASVEAFMGADDHHNTTVSAGDFLDEKYLVLTVSVDAIVKVWDQQRVLLRQVTLATAVSSLCFLNADGDLLAGLTKGTFFISRRDILPDKIPKPPPRRRIQDIAQDTKTEVCDQLENVTNAPTLESAPSNQQIPTLEDPKFAHAALPPPQKIFLPSRPPDPETSAKQLLAHVIQRPIEAANLRPPVLRSLNSSGRISSSRLGSFSNSTSEHQTALLTPALTAMDQQEEDWRDKILPLSPYQKLMRAPQRGMSYRRKRSEIPSSPLVLQTLGPSPRTSLTKCRPSSENNDSSVTPGEECHYPPEGLPPLGLGLGSAESPLLYCKHQAPVPPKDKTPRKLWNAIGGEDRRLIVLQRNHLPPC